MRKIYENGRWYILDDEFNLTLDDVTAEGIFLTWKGHRVHMMADPYGYVYFAGDDLGGQFADRLVDAMNMARETLVDIMSL